MRFVNREQELGALERVLEGSDSSPGPVVAILSGMHGVGKSAVGSHWANHVRTRFGGDLFGDFSRKRHRGGVEVSDVLGEFIRDLGTADAAIPPTLSQRTKLYRRITASRRLLVLLDDVGQAAHVKPLLPSGAGSVVIVTSNSHLEELVHEGAELVPVDPLDGPASRKLLAEMAGSERMDRELEQVDRLVSICDGLPIALCVCGGRLAIHRTHSVGWLVEQIEDEAERLRGLSGKGELSVEEVFDFAYADLDAPDAIVYRGLGIQPGVDFAAVQVAVAAGLPVAAASERLETLSDAHLVEPLHGGRYRLHDLIRLHMRNCSERDEPATARDASLRRLVDWYYGALRNADRAVVRSRLRLAESEEVQSPNLPEFDSPKAAFDWFEVERANIIAVVRAARDRELNDRVWQMGEALWLFYYNHKHYADWIESTEVGVVCARRSSNLSAEARMRAQLARAHMDLGNFTTARSELVAAENAAEASGNERLCASVREFLGICHLDQGDYVRALDALRQARAVFELRKELRGVAIQDYHIGLALIKNGEPDAAFAPLGQALDTMRSVDDQLSVGRIMLHLGRAKQATRELDEARHAFEESIKILAPLGVRLEEAEAYEELATIAELRKKNSEAAFHRRSAYRIYRDMGHPRASDLAAVA